MTLTKKARVILSLALPVALVGLAGCSPAEPPAENAGAAPVEMSAAPAAPEAPAAETAETSTTEAVASAAPAPATPAPATPAPAPAAAGAKVSGTVKFDGPRPVRKEIAAESDPKCHGTTPILTDSEMVSENGGVQFAFVSVSNAPAGDYPVPAEKAVLDQRGCMYSPHVLGMRTGQDLEIVNGDPTTHNVRSFSKANKVFNIGQPKDTAPRIKKFDKAENEIKMKCDVHPWMQSYIFAMEHPFFAVTDAEGAFAIPGLPAGTYTLSVWHERYGKQELQVTVSGDVADANFTYKP